MKKLRIWVPTDQETWGAPRAIAQGAAPPQPGRVYEIAARNGAEALRELAIASRSEPDPEADPSAWAEWKLSARRVELVGEWAKAEPPPNDPKKWEAWKRLPVQEVTSA